MRWISMPMRGGYADKIFIITSGENMAIHAAANIAMAVENFKNRGYAGLGGLILNRRDVPREEEKWQNWQTIFTQLLLVHYHTAGRWHWQRSRKNIDGVLSNR